MMAIVVGVCVGIWTGVGAAVIVGSATVPVLWPLFALAVKGRWGQQPGVENVDFGHFLRRPWSRLSGRVLSWFIWLSAFVAWMSVVELVIGPARASALFNLSVSSLLLGTAWLERRRRMSA